MLIKSTPQQVCRILSFSGAWKAVRQCGLYGPRYFTVKKWAYGVAFGRKKDICGARDTKLSEPVVTLPLLPLNRDVTHRLVKVGAGGKELSASHRIDRFPGYTLILNQAGLIQVTKDQVRKIVICPRHRRNFTFARSKCPCQCTTNQTTVNRCFTG